MKRSLAAIALACAGLSLSGCAHGFWGIGVGTHWVSHPYTVWYNGYYGPFYDGYWGMDGFFYFRLDSRDRDFRRGSPDYFRRERPQSPDFRRYEGQPNRPPRGGKMPNYPK